MKKLKEFPIHAFVDYDPDYGIISVKKEAPLEIRKRIRKFDHFVSYNGETSAYESFDFRAKGTPYKRDIFTACRVAWRIAYGKWPEGRVMMIDGNTKNIKLSNLRISDSGIAGVIFEPDRGLWQAQIGSEKLGRFEDKLSACAARRSAELRAN